MSESSKEQKLQVSLDYRWICIGLAAVIAAMLAVWKPWAPGTSDRTVEVTGQATVSARPDEFVFYPTYEFTNSSKQQALDALAAKSGEIVAQLKKIGVANKDIQTNSGNWSYPVYDGTDNKTPTYTLSLTITVNSDALAQKVQDYLVTTAPSGSVSPQATFSEAKRRQVEDQGRDEAAKDARKKAEQSAKNLGFRLAAVKVVNDGAGFGGPMPYAADKAMATDSANRSSLAIQPGENKLTYTVTVTYFIR